MSPFGIRILSNPLAETVKVRYVVAQAGGPRPRRRKAWCVRRVEERQPAVWQLGEGTFVAHPSLVAKLKAEVRA
ncbi:hypothetical protein [Caldimonas brevitalea]|uniref:Uncharacterized protein n=1 Tax=Caldimonas brevitalea TaxID=413882 RepID=A0A0G3BQL6_9BURK|nr:hypothetical protein [Caldimonas brevitalea]AKJ28800.1 hypothetical protein AAW51_2109 [Caldimonas brevitalea]